MKRLTRNQIDVLKRLAEEPAPIAGVRVADTILLVGRSSVYAALEALEREGLVCRHWDHAQPRPRRLSVITEAGRAALVEQRAGVI